MAIWGRHLYGQKFILCWEGYTYIRRQHQCAGFIGTVAMYIKSLLHILLLYMKRIKWVIYSFYVETVYTKACMMNSIVCTKLSFSLLSQCGKKYYTGSINPSIHGISHTYIVYMNGDNLAVVLFHM